MTTVFAKTKDLGNAFTMAQKTIAGQIGKAVEGAKDSLGQACTKIGQTARHVREDLRVDVAGVQTHMAHGTEQLGYSLRYAAPDVKDALRQTGTTIAEHLTETGKAIGASTRSVGAAAQELGKAMVTSAKDSSLAQQATELKNTAVDTTLTTVGNVLEKSSSVLRGPVANFLDKTRRRLAIKTP